MRNSLEQGEAIVALGISSSEMGRVGVHCLGPRAVIRLIALDHHAKSINERPAVTGQSVKSQDGNHHASQDHHSYR